MEPEQHTALTERAHPLQASGGGDPQLLRQVPVGAPTVSASCSVVAAALFWSSSYAVTKEVLADVGPLSIRAVRFTIAAVLLEEAAVPERTPVGEHA
ncbi:DMT family transporter [Streptomyces sp. NBC_01231]|nr:DMT family transporter [Streptomyces sp. NBC_01231]